MAFDRETAFLTELLQSITDRSLRLLRRGGNGYGDGHDAADLASHLISSAGEASGVALARRILDRWAAMDRAERLAWFGTLAAEFGPVEERLKKGEDFAKVATDVSKDPGSGKEGGDLGWFTKDRMVPEFAEAAFKLKKGEVSAPVKSQFGWHVIKLEDKRTKPLPDYAAVKPQIEQYLERKAQQDAVLALREKAKVERLDKPAAPATPAPDAAKPAEPKKN